MPTPQKALIVEKILKHVFTEPEVVKLNVEFRQSFSALQSVEKDIEAQKAIWKSRSAEAESKMTSLHARLEAGFEMQPTKVAVTFRPNVGKKDFTLLGEDNLPTGPVVLTEDMGGDDFAQDLIRAEAMFTKKVELPIWAAGGDHGKVVVGFFSERWYAAVRGNIGAKKLEERMDSEQAGYKNREDAIRKSTARASDWIEEEFGPEAVKGIKASLQKAIEAAKGKEE